MQTTDVNKEIFSPAEQADLDLAKKVRTRIITEYTEDELPKSFDMDRLLTAVNQLETGALSVAKIRIKQQEVDGKDTSNAVLAQLLLSIQSKPPEVVNAKMIDDDLLILPDSLDITPVEGGLRMGEQNDDLYDEIFGTDDEPSAASM